MSVCISETTGLASEAKFKIDLTWFRVERQSQYYLEDDTLLVYRPAILQYLYFLALSVLETFSFHITARSLTSWLKGPVHNLKTMVTTALLVSSCMLLPLSFHDMLICSGARIVPVFMVIWQYDLPESVALVDWVVMIYNTEALRGKSPTREEMSLTMDSTIGL